MSKLRYTMGVSMNVDGRTEKTIDDNAPRPLRGFELVVVDAYVEGLTIESVRFGDREQLPRPLPASEFSDKPRTRGDLGRQIAEVEANIQGAPPSLARSLARKAKAWREKLPTMPEGAARWTFPADAELREGERITFAVRREPADDRPFVGSFYAYPVESAEPAPTEAKPAA